jgi:hypothetical protein
MYLRYASKVIGGVPAVASVLLLALLLLPTFLLLLTLVLLLTFLLLLLRFPAVASLLSLDLLPTGIPDVDGIHVVGTPLAGCLYPSCFWRTRTCCFVQWCSCLLKNKHAC